MKKNILYTLILAVLLTGCASQGSKKTTDTSSSAKTEQTSESTSEKTTEESSATEESSSEPSSSEEAVEKTEAYQYEIEENGEKQIVKETIVYKGDEFIKLELHITNEATQATRDELAGLDFATVRSQMLTYLDEQPAVQQLKAVQGVTMGTDITPEYNIIMDVHIDMLTADLKALSEVEGMGADLTQIKEVTPKQYILGLQLNGAQAVNQ